MKTSLRRFSIFSLAVVIGASAFGLFWSATVQASGGTYCSKSGPYDMCYVPTNSTSTAVPYPDQPGKLALNSKGHTYWTCGACAASKK